MGAPLRPPGPFGGSNNELAHGHGVRCCRYRGQRKAHLQHVFTAIAANIERLSRRPPTGGLPACASR
ncbi:transposase [Streptomyces clavifer]